MQAARTSRTDPTASRHGSASRRLPDWRGSRRVVRALALWAFTAGSFLAPASMATASEDGSCVYNRRIYPDGTELCQGSQRVRCEAGAWDAIGMCTGDEPAPEPISSGGDEELR